MTNRDLAHTLDAVANQMQVVIGLTNDLRSSIGADARTLANLAGTVDGVVRLLKWLQPKTSEDA